MYLFQYGVSSKTRGVSNNKSTILILDFEETHEETLQCASQHMLESRVHHSVRDTFSPCETRLITWDG